MLGSAGALLAPVLSWPPFILGVTRDQLPKTWLLLWFGYALPLAAVDAAAGRWHYFALDVLQALIGVLAARLFVARASTLRRGLLIALGLIAILGSVEMGAYRVVWKAPGLNPRVAIEPSLIWGVDEVADPGTYRLWRRSHPSDALVMSFQARAVNLVAESTFIATISVDLLDADSDLGRSSRLQFTVTGDWSEASLNFASPELAGLSELRTVLRLPAGQAVELRNFRFAEASTGVRVSPVNPFPRQQLWFGHPNLLGHSAAIAGLAFAVVPGVGVVTGLGVATSLFVILLSGSRAALAALLLGIFAVYALRARHAQRAAWRAIILTTGVLALLVVGYGLMVGRGRADNGQVPRVLIAETAVDAILAHPWLGLSASASAFKDFSSARNGPQTASVTHAHNWWLQNGVTNGLPGLGGGLWFFICLAVIAWRSSRSTGLVLVASLGLMQLVDVTLLSWGVLLPFTLILNTRVLPRQQGSESE